MKTYQVTKRVAILTTVLTFAVFSAASAFDLVLTVPHRRSGLHLTNTNQGVKIVRVDQNSPAENAGCRPNDLITSISNPNSGAAQARNVNAVIRMLEDASGDTTLSMLNPAGRRFNLVMRLPGRIAPNLTGWWRASIRLGGFSHQVSVQIIHNNNQVRGTFFGIPFVGNSSFDGLIQNGKIVANYRADNGKKGKIWLDMRGDSDLRGTSREDGSNTVLDLALTR